MSCCRKLVHRYSDASRGVFCLTWVLPIRIFIITTLVMHLLYKIIHGPFPYDTILIFIHIPAALALLRECRRSVRYHNAIRELDKLGDKRRALR